jgi:hypothetical protein
MKRRALTVTFILSLSLSTMAGAQLVNLGRANPYFYEQVPYSVSPPSDVNPPTISIVSPKNNSVYISHNVFLTFNVSIIVPLLPELFYYSLDLAVVYYKASWLSNNTYLDLEAVRNSIPPRPRLFSEDYRARWNTYWAISGYELSPTFSVNLTGVPEGTHSIEVFAVLRGSRGTSQSESAMTIYYGMYKLPSSSMINFTVHSTSVLSPQNKTYNTADVPLLFRVHESVTQIAYSLDGQDTVIIAGNTTLKSLHNGDHNVTVYTTDETGNTGASETVYFIVDAPEPIPTAWITVAVASVAIACAVFLVYFKKSKR